MPINSNVTSEVVGRMPDDATDAMGPTADLVKNPEVARVAALEPRGNVLYLISIRTGAMRSHGPDPETKATVKPLEIVRFVGKIYGEGVRLFV